MSSKRQLAAIMFTDIAGYTRLMQESEVRANQLRQRHREVFERYHKEFNGEILQYYGDGTLSIFDSCVDAVKSAIVIQRELQHDPVVPLRIGIHLGDIVRTKSDVYGDGVNLASRVESMGMPHAILISEDVYKQVKNHEIDSVSMGLFEMKNVQKPMEVFAIQAEGLVIPEPQTLQGKAKKVKARPHTNNWKRVAGVGATFLLLGAVLFWIFATGKSDSRRVESIQEARVATIPFENNTGNSGLDALGLLGSEWIISGLQALNISTLAREIADQHKDKVGILPNDPHGNPSFAEITGAQYVIMGSYYLDGSGDSIVLNTRLNSTQTGEQIHTFPTVKDHIDSKENLIHEARQYILGFWGLRKEQRIPNINPPKYDAYKTILECYSHQSQCFQEVLAIDPDFLFARIRLMGSCTFNSNDSVFYSNKAIVKKELNRLTAFERAMFEMYCSGWEGDRTEKIKHIRQLHQVDTNNYLPLQWLGYNLLADNASIEASEKFSRIFEKADLFGRQIGVYSYENYIEAHVRTQEYRKASDFYLNLTNEQQKIAGKQSSHYTIQALIFQNRIQEVYDLIEMRENKAESYLVAAYAYNYIYPNQINPFAEDLQGRIGEFSQNEQIDPSVFNWNTKAMAYYVLKDWENAKASLLEKKDLLEIKFDKPFDRFPDPDYWKKLWHTGMLGCVYAHLGKLEDCQVQVDQLDNLRKLYPKTNSTYHRGVVPYLQARIASILGNKERALKLLNTSIKEGRLLNNWNYHFDQDFLPLKDDPPFKEILKPKDS